MDINNSIIGNLNISGNFTVSSNFRKKDAKDILDLIIYLFHNNNGINQFNILPKLILLMEKEQNYNEFHVDKVNMEYKIRDGKQESTINWNIIGIKNISKTEVSQMYFYTGIDYGIMATVEAREENGGNVEARPMRKENESNEINRFVLGFESKIAPKRKLDRIRLSTKLKKAYDLSKQEIIYFYPYNFGRIIDEINYNVEIYDKDNYVIELREIYKDKKNFKERVIKSIKGKVQDTYKLYGFKITEVNMKSVYYFTINKV